MSTLWSATINHIGPDASDMVEAGVLILFGHGVPPALADVSLVHTDSKPATRPIAAGDRFSLGDQVFTVDAVGELANGNLDELGHVVLYVNQPEQQVLPGAVMVTGEPPAMPELGTRLSFDGE